MTITAEQAAKFVCQKNNWELTNLKLQKILYIANMIYFGKHEEPLIKESFEAWDYGPVIPSLYHKVKMFGKDPIENVFHYTPDVKERSKEYETLKRAAEYLGQFTAGQLVNITHKDDGAWYNKYQPGVKGIEIGKEDIQSEYEAHKK